MPQGGAMATTYLESLLSEHERILLVNRQHWIFLLRNLFLEALTILLILVFIILGATLLTGGIGIVILIGVAILLIPLLSMIHDILKWTNRQYIVTNRRVVQLSGIVNKEVTDSSLEKVNDVKMAQSALGRMMDYGDIEILTASEMGVNLFKQIEKPVRFKTAMLNAKEKMDYREDSFGHTSGDSIPAMIAQLEDLRRHGVLTEAEFQEKKAALLAKL
jgi:uncharacterized membrane protein YdbT with pleckstrin-like domain